MLKPTKIASKANNPLLRFKPCLDLIHELPRLSLEMAKNAFVIANEVKQSMVNVRITYFAVSPGLFALLTLKGRLSGVLRTKGASATPTDCND